MLLKHKESDYYNSLNSLWTFWDVPGGPVVKTSPSKAGVVGSVPGWGAKIPHASWPENQNIKQKQYRDKFNKDF